MLMGAAMLARALHLIIIILTKITLNRISCYDIRSMIPMIIMFSHFIDFDMIDKF